MIGLRCNGLQRLGHSGADEEEVLPFFPPRASHSPLDLSLKGIVQSSFNEGELQAGDGRVSAQAPAGQIPPVHDLADTLVEGLLILLGLDVEHDHLTVEQARSMQQALDLSPTGAPGQPFEEELTR